ncbi:hypothetical protein RQP46_000604 [Phenoliferia psychrophenolica]
MDTKPPVSDAVPPPAAPTPPAAGAGATPPAPVAAPASASSSSSSASRFAPPKPLPKENPFVYLGIPQAVFDYRPKVPGPKMSVFLALTIGSTVAYLYDRRECKRLKQHYIDEVKWMSEDKLGTTDLARKVRILAARIPEDSTVDRSTIFFKRYIRPYLVASGTDFQITTGRNPGGLGRTLISEIRARRITEASEQGASSTPPPVSPFTSGGDPNFVLDDRDEARRASELGGGYVLLGRGALKEYLWALKKGYGEDIDLKEEARLQGLGLGSTEKRKDSKAEREEEVLVRELEREDAANPNAPFDIPEPAGLASIGSSDDGDAEHDASPPSLSSAGYTPYRVLTPTSAPLPPVSKAPSYPDSHPLILPARQIPPQPPLLLVPFSHPFGVRQWPQKMLHFFNHRADVRQGGELALALLTNHTRPFEPPVNRDGLNNLEGMLDLNFVDEVRRGLHKDAKLEEGVLTGSADLDLVAESDELPSHFLGSYRELPKSHEFRSRDFYKELEPRLVKARELADGRTPTSAEQKNPPKMESELRKERLDKEMRWRWELEGWAVVRSGSGVAWDEKWTSNATGESPFRVVTPVTDQDKEALRRAREQWEATEAAKRKERQDNGWE